MKRIDEPTYKKYIVQPLQRFDGRDTGFSRGVGEGDKYTKMHSQSIDNLKRGVPGKSILDHATWVAGRTVDYLLRKTMLAREGAPVYNDQYQLATPDPLAITNIVKKVSRWLGADLVGIAKLNSTWIYSHWGAHNSSYTQAAETGDPIELPPQYKYAVVLIHEMAYEGIKKSPSVEPETDIGYSRIGFSASSLATFIRELGYSAIPAVNELALSIPLAVDAGLGELGRMGLLITREFGPRVRISKVFTDLELVPDRPIDIGVQRFCEKCQLCAKYCMAQAIPPGHRTDTGWDQSNNSGMLKWPVKAMKCLDWWVSNGTHCSVCIRVCPWNKPTTLFHRAIRNLAERKLFTRPMVRMDELLGYGKQNRTDWSSTIKNLTVRRKHQETV